MVNEPSVFEPQADDLLYFDLLLGFNDPLRQYFSIKPSPKERKKEQGDGMDDSNKIQTAPIPHLLQSEPVFSLY